MDDGGTAEISLEFYSNPAPDSVVWNVVGTSDTQSLQISAGSDNERSVNNLIFLLRIGNKNNNRLYFYLFSL